MMHFRDWIWRIACAALLAAGAHAPLTSAQEAAAALKFERPEAMGFSQAGLQELNAALKDIVERRHLAGMITLLARHGRVVDYKAVGYQDLERKSPLRKDAIVNIYSMTKPITGVAMMMLYEEGKWRPEDPIAKHIPEFKDLKVLAGADSDGKPIYEAPKHAPTMGELMSHSAGFTYGFLGSTPVDKLYQADNPLAAPSLQAFIDKLAKLPLAYQPGEKWVYSLSVDIQGYLVQKLSGRSLPDFFRERIFAPLKMRDTDFFVPKNKLSRVAAIYSWNRDKNALAPAQRDLPVAELPGLPQGGMGLYSTAADYFRFAQMMLNGGELDGVRLLKPSSVATMRVNHLSETALNSQSGVGFATVVPGQGISAAQGFGYDFAVVNDPGAINAPVGKGTFWWYGAAGTWFWIDPANDIVFVGIIQRRGGVPGAASHGDLSRALVYKALVDASK